MKREMWRGGSLQEAASVAYIFSSSPFGLGFEVMLFRQDIPAIPYAGYLPTYLPTPQVPVCRGFDMDADDILPTLIDGSCCG